MTTAASPFSILPQSTAPHPHEHFAAARELEARLRATVRGEVRFDDAARALYATDASNYRQLPIGLVCPLDTEDVIAAVAACRAFGAPVLSRGAGTSLAGQCCNVAVVLDLSRHMGGVLALDAAARTARVQPGVVLDTLRHAAERHELTFAPDPATHNRCTLGGMIGNNSCGVHALMGGKTVDNIESLEILLYDGTRLRVGKTSESELADIIAAGGRRGEIYAALRSIRDTYASLVRQRFPAIPRRVSGYNLDQLLPENGFNVARALVGSEGTCVTVLEATCVLTPSPQFRRLVALGFADAFTAADHVPAVLAHGPIGLEGFDGLLVDFMRRKHLVVDDVKLLPAGRGFLLCEFGADTAEAADRQALGLVAAATLLPGSPSTALYTEDEAARVWHVREAALGATVFVPGEASGWEGWEDSAVPPEHLGAYLRELFALLDRFSYRSPIYGHFGQGCVHLRINFHLRTVEGVADFRRFIDLAADIVLKYGGSFSGEHGDGQARAALLPKMFGPELMEAFRQFKAIWDPLNRMNPGKLVDPVRVYDPTENLRVGPTLKTGEAADAAMWFQFPNDGGSFAEATHRCVGVGACRKEDRGTMCPSYMATREETHSTRGRAHLLWELLHGTSLEHGWRNTAVRDALDLCLSCKACKTECPVNVDMAMWKSEFLAHHYAGRLHPLHHYAFGFMDCWTGIASRLPRLANAPLRVPAVDALVKKLLGIAPQRTLPRLARRSFRDTFNAKAANATAGRRVLLWPDTWNNYFHPQALEAAHKLLGSAGCSVRIPREPICCGRPLYDFGFLDQARAYLSRILDTFEAEIRDGTPVVMLEPSCATVFRDELLNLLPDDPRAQRLSRQTMLLGDLLADPPTPWSPPRLDGRRIVVHGHCHQKAVLSMAPDMALLRATGAIVDLLDSGCCGMAGPYGFEADKFAISQALAERVLLPAARAARPEDLLVSNGFSCREQISQNTSRRALHLAEVLTLGL